MKMVKIISDEFIEIVDRLNKAYDNYCTTGRAFMKNMYFEHLVEITKIMNKASNMGLNWDFIRAEKHIVFEYYRSDKNETGKAFAYTSQPEIIVAEFTQRI